MEFQKYSAINTVMLFGASSPKLIEKAESHQSTPPSLPVSDSKTMEGVYSDPRIDGGGAPTDTEIAIRTMQEIRSVRENEMRAIQAEARANLEAELGRRFEPDEGFETLSIHQRAELSKPVLNASNDALYSGRMLSLSSGDFSEFKPSLNIKFDSGKMVVTKVEDYESAGDLANELLEKAVELQMGGVRKSLSEGSSKQLMEKALTAAGVTDMDALKESLLTYHRERYENGDLTLAYDGRAV